jgi:hypothetical protein
MNKIVIKNSHPVDRNLILASLFIAAIALFIFFQKSFDSSSYPLIILSLFTCIILFIAHVAIQFFLGHNQLVLTPSFIEIDKEQLTWDQITEFTYYYGLIGNSRHPYYLEKIMVRGLKNGKIFTFHCQNEDRLISSIDREENQNIKEQIQLVNKKTDEEALKFVRNSSSFIYLSIVSSLLMLINFTGLLTALKYSRYSSIIVSNTYPFAVFVICIIVLIIASLKAFIKLEDYSFSEKYHQIQYRLGLSLFLSFITLFSVKSIMAGVIYRAARDTGIVNFKVVDKYTMIHQGKYGARQVLFITLSSSDIKDFFITGEFGMSCDSTLKVDSEVGIPFYETLDHQYFYVAANNGQSDCYFAEKI